MGTSGTLRYTRIPSYWPVAMRITPHWHYESAGRQPVDTVPGDPTSLTEQTINTSGFDLTGIDILAAGTLAKNISFLLVPSIDPGDGTVGFESANVRLDNLRGSPWLNFKFGKFELIAAIREAHDDFLQRGRNISALPFRSPRRSNDEIFS